MKIAFYISTRKPWYIGLGNRLIRLRLKSQISHCEMVFEPGDGVDHLMPDGTTVMDDQFTLWCAGSSASDKIPDWSERRKGKHGGVRFKRINVQDSSKWLLVDIKNQNTISVYNWFNRYSGAMYDWQGIVGFIAWFIPHQTSRWTCHEACAAALGIEDAWRLDPASLYNVVNYVAEKSSTR